MGFCAPIIYAYIETLQRDGGAGESVIGERFTLYDTTDATADLLVVIGCNREYDSMYLMK